MPKDINKNTDIDKIVIISHHKMVRDWFKNFCKENLKYSIVKYYGSIQNIKSLDFNKDKLFVILCVFNNDDLDKNPQELLPRLKYIFPNNKTIMINSTLTDDEKIMYLKLGVKGFIKNNFAEGDIKKAFETISNNQLWIRRSLSNRLVFTQLKKTGNDDYKKPDNYYNLTKREIEVLQSMTAGLSNIEISDRLFICEKTVKAHISNIFKKMEVRSRTQAIIKAINREVI